MAKKKTTNKKDKGKKGLSPNEVKILTTLKKGRELTRSEISEKTEITKGFSKLLGAATREVSPTSLQGRKLVSVAKYEDSRQLKYKITAAGKKALESK